jgi:hypothetical protein
MAEPRPILDYAQAELAARLPSLPWQALAALLPLFFVPATQCACGHLAPVGLLFSGPAASLAWWGFARKCAWSGWRVLVVAVVIVASIVFLKNAADVLWFGHAPLLGGRGP